jgi:hypothetical protein
MVRSILNNIETAKAVMEDGAVGYVCHTKDFVHCLCQNGTAAVRLGEPLADDVAVLTTHARAVVLQRYWNSVRGDGDTLNRVVISLRREALTGYIDVQQKTLDVLTSMGAPNNV